MRIVILEGSKLGWVILLLGRWTEGDHYDQWNTNSKNTLRLPARTGRKALLQTRGETAAITDEVVVTMI